MSNSDGWTALLDSIVGTCRVIARGATRIRVEADGGPAMIELVSRDDVGGTPVVRVSVPLGRELDLPAHAALRINAALLVGTLAAVNGEIELRTWAPLAAVDADRLLATIATLLETVRVIRRRSAVSRRDAMTCFVAYAS